MIRPRHAIVCRGLIITFVFQFHYILIVCLPDGRIVTEPSGRTNLAEVPCGTVILIMLRPKDARHETEIVPETVGKEMLQLPSNLSVTSFLPSPTRTGAISNSVNPGLRGLIPHISEAMTASGPPLHA